MFLRNFCSNPASSEEAPHLLMKTNPSGLTELLLNRPKTKNAMSRQLLQLLTESVSEIEAAPAEHRVVLLRSSTPGMFCSGADLKERKGMTPDEAEQFVQNFRRLSLRLSKLPSPTISLIDGFALGGGLEIALSTDLRVATESAVLALPETGLAIIPGAGGT